MKFSVDQNWVTQQKGASCLGDGTQTGSYSVGQTLKMGGREEKASGLLEKKAA